MLSFLNRKKKSVIGIFDSGIGGFSVAKKIQESTSSNIIYFGDCANAPYGNRSDDAIRNFIKDDIYFLKAHGVTHFVNACNSMSVMTTNLLLEECGVELARYTDMVRSFETYASFSSSEKVLVIATHATLRSGVYQDALTKKSVPVEVFPYSELAQAIEEGKEEDVLKAIITPGIVAAKACGATIVLYGCTHYPLVHTLFVSVAEEIGFQGTFLDPALYVALSVASWDLEGDRKFYPYTSKETQAFARAVVSLL